MGARTIITGDGGPVLAAEVLKAMKNIQGGFCFAVTPANNCRIICLGQLWEGDLDDTKAMRDALSHIIRHMEKEKNPE